MLLNFGQPSDGIIQIAYVVQDLQRQMSAYAENLRVGPWFALQRFRGSEARYRGNECRAEIALAIAFSGHTMIELIEPLDEHPSVFRETILARGHGFHHFGRASTQFDADVAAYIARGYEVALEDRPVPGGGRIAYLDTHGELPGFIEVIEYDFAMEQMFSRFYQAAIGWDGTSAVRPFFDRDGATFAA